MAIIAKANGKDFERPKLGLVQAVCVFVEDVGTHKSTYNGKELLKHQVVICWELSQKMTEGEYKDKPFMISNFYTLSLDKKANLAHDLESWFSKELTPEQRANGIDLEKLIGKNCMLNLVEKKKLNGDIRIGIAGISPVMDGLVTLEKYNQVAPEWIGDLRKQSMEMQGAENENQAGQFQSSSDLPF